MKKSLCFSFLIISFAANAQVFWTEDFGTGCDQGNTAASYSGTNGIWNVILSGTNDTYASEWYVSGTEAGMGAGNCGDGCLNNSSLTNRTLHVSSSPLLVGDAGAAYNTGGLCGFGICVATDKRAESPTINCAGHSNITVTFNYMMEGQAGSDYAALAYYDGITWNYYTGSTWTTAFFSLPLTANSSCSPQGTWAPYSAPLPASANNNANAKIGFRWKNNDDGVGSDPSFAVDDITLSSPTVSCSVTISVTQPLLCYGDCNGQLTANATGNGPFTYWWDALPPAPFPNLSNLCAGMHSVHVTDAAACTTSTVSFTLTQPTQLTVGSSLCVNPACHGECTGSCSLNISGGTPPYNYSPLTNLCAGVYSTVVTDANGCTTSASTVVTEPPPLVLGNLTNTNPSCIGCSNGSICIGTSSGGTPGYTFSINPTATLSSNCFVNLTQGVYTICITDANGCTVCQSDTLHDPPSAVGENYFSDEVIIFPNPVSKAFTIYDLQFTVYGIEISDAIGKKITLLHPTSNIKRQTTFDISELKPGIYFFKLIGDDRKMLGGGKFVVQ